MRMLTIWLAGDFLGGLWIIRMHWLQQHSSWSPPEAACNAEPGQPLLWLKVSTQHRRHLCYCNQRAALILPQGPFRCGTRRGLNGCYSLFLLIDWLSVRVRLHVTVPKQAMFPSSPMYFRSHLAASDSVGSLSDMSSMANTAFWRNSALSSKLILASKQTTSGGGGSCWKGRHDRGTHKNQMDRMTKQ